MVQTESSQGLKPDFLIAANGTAEQAAEKVREADPSRAEARSGSLK